MKRKIYIEGDKTEAFCSSCKNDVTVSFTYKPYKTDNGEFIPNVLQGFCFSCKKRLLTPPQSIPRIKPFYARQSKTEEYLVPRVIEDALLMVGDHVGLEKPDAFKVMLRFYLTSEKKDSWMKINEKFDLGPANTRLSFRLDPKTSKTLIDWSEKMNVSKNLMITKMIWDAKDRLVDGGPTSKKFLAQTSLLRI